MRYMISTALTATCSSQESIPATLLELHQPTYVMTSYIAVITSSLCKLTGPPMHSQMCNI